LYNQDWMEALKQDRRREQEEFEEEQEHHHTQHQEYQQYGQKQPSRRVCETGGHLIIVLFLGMERCEV